MRKKHLIIGIFCCLFFFSCDEDSVTPEASSDEPQSNYPNFLIFEPGDEEAIELALINLKANTDIYLKQGRYNFENLSIQGPLDNILFRGENPKKTILDFSGQTSGGEGFRVDDVTNFTIRDIKLINSTGDLIKVKSSTGVNFINMRAIWEGKPSSENGGYGIYPVECKDVLIDSCVVRGASDAGIYVGQTIGAIVRNNTTYNNVAGIEIENTQNAVVYKNRTHSNTGGLLVFDLPNLSINTNNVKVYDNAVFSNNYRNFAPSALSFTGVGNVPPGTGIMILAATNVEVYNNNITDNNTMPVGIVSTFTTTFGSSSEFENDLDFDPYPRDIYVHDNFIKKQNDFPEVAMDHEFGGIIIALHTALKFLDKTGTYWRLQEVLHDGYVDESNPNTICIQEDEKTRFVNFNFDALFDLDLNNLESIDLLNIVETDIEPYDCSL